MPSLRYGCPITFGSEESEEKWFREAAQAAKDMHERGIELFVAPRVSLRLDDGTMLPPLSEVRREMFEGEDQPAHVRLRRLMAEGRVLESDG